MDIEKRTLTTTEQSVLENDLLDVQDWVNKAIDGKVAACKKRMIAQWLPILYADDSVTTIPAQMTYRGGPVVCVHVRLLF